VCVCLFVCVCMFACMCVCMYICMCVHLCVHVHANKILMHAYAGMLTHTHNLTYTYTYIRAHDLKPHFYRLNPKIFERRAASPPATLYLRAKSVLLLNGSGCYTLGDEYVLRSSAPWTAVLQEGQTEVSCCRRVAHV